MARSIKPLPPLAATKRFDNDYIVTVDRTGNVLVAGKLHLPLHLRHRSRPRRNDGRHGHACVMVGCERISHPNRLRFRSDVDSKRLGFERRIAHDRRYGLRQNMKMTAAFTEPNAVYKP
jgi:hypothetical protein